MQEEYKIRAFKIERGLLRRLYSSWRLVARRLKIEGPMMHAMQVFCAAMMVKNSFHELMSEVWREFPNQKIIKCKEVYNERVELPLPNYLQVSKQDRYCDFFVKSNITLLK